MHDSLLIEPEQLLPQLDSSDLCVVDLSAERVHRQLHIPGARFLDYGEIVASQPPIHGLVPEGERVAMICHRLGIEADTRVIAYDDEGGGKAARWLWTLHLYGHQRITLLNGGLHAWAGGSYPLIEEPSPPSPTSSGAPRALTLQNRDALAETDYIQQRLGQRDFALWDARTPGEYEGRERRALQAGHIPGAVNLEWSLTLDRDRHLRLLPESPLRQMLSELGLTPDKEVVAYCHTHHRSAHSWYVLHLLGYDHAKGYPGSWSDWGNRDDLPIE